MLGKANFIKLVEENISPAEFTNIKKAFKDDINSARRFEQITDVTTLLNVLEDRFTLNSDRLEALHVIVSNIEKLKDITVNVNGYFEQETKEGLPEAVLELVCAKYQGDCNELGRQLGLDEEEVQQKCENIQNLLLCFSAKSDKISTQEVCFRLSRALETCSETSLALGVQELMKRTILICHFLRVKGIKVKFVGSFQEKVQVEDKMSSHHSGSKYHSERMGPRPRFSFGEHQRDFFQFSDHKQELISLLKTTGIVHDFEDFWKFFLKFEKIQNSAHVHHYKMLCFELNITVDELLKHVTSQALNKRVLGKFVAGVYAYINFKQMERFNALRKVRKVQMELPVSSFEEEIGQAVTRNKVTIIAGDTGCGKSTQIPQYLMKKYKSIVCTQPRRIACISLCSRLKHETLNRYSDTIGYQIRFEKSRSRKTRILFLTEGLLVRQMIADPLLSCYNVVILDEVHERHLQSDFLLGLLKCLLTKRHDLKVILMSATINVNLFYSYFQGMAEVITVPGRLFPVDVIYWPPVTIINSGSKKTKVDVTPYLQIMQLIDEKYQGEKGDLLIFMSGMAEITCLAEAIDQYKSESPYWIVLLLHSSLALADQDKVFDYAPEGYRKCIISTNIAETSVTIEGVRFVIDSGKVKQMSYDPIYKMKRLKEFWISRSSAEQRKGRAGRTGPGTCYRIYSEREYLDFDEYSVPEIKRLPLDAVLLQMIGMGLPDVRKFPFLEDPSMENIENCVVNLKQLNALTSDEKITEIGKTLTYLPVELTIGKMLIVGSIFRQVDTTIALASALSVPPIYTNNAFRDIEMVEMRKGFESDHGDSIMLLNLFREWLNLKKMKENSRRWCRRSGIEEQRFYEIIKLIRQFQEILSDNDFLEHGQSQPQTSNERRIRYGELKMLEKMKAEQTNRPGRKKLKVENYEVDDETGEIDVKDIEFRLKNDTRTVVDLWKKIELSSAKALVILKIVFCSGFYPQFAIDDEYNYSRSEQLFHTKTKSHVSLHPLSHFATHPEVLKISGNDIIEPTTKIKYNGKRFSSKHKMICFTNLIETNKMYLTNMIQMPALQSFLFFAKNVDTSFNLSKIICDNWVLFELLNPRQSEVLILKLIKLRKTWNSVISKRLKHIIDLEEVEKLTDELTSFINSDVVYAMRRLLPADLKYLYSGKKDFREIEENFFDPDYEIRENPKKGGIFVTEYLTYNCVLPNEYEEWYASSDFDCRNCGGIFDFNCLERLEHMCKCSNTPEVVTGPIQKRSPNTKEFACENCGGKFYFTTVEILRHKKKCK